jgi:hypothetical protein
LTLDRELRLLQDSVRRLLTRDKLAATEVQIYVGLSSWISSRPEGSLSEEEKSELATGVVRLNNMTIEELVKTVWNGGLVPHAAILEAIESTSKKLTDALKHLRPDLHP